MLLGEIIAVCSEIYAGYIRVSREEFCSVKPDGINSKKDCNGLTELIADPNGREV
jgi:hypothetical protein